MSRFYLCDFCMHWRKWRPNYTGLEGRCTITEQSGSLFYKKKFASMYTPKQVCDVFKRKANQ